MHTQINHSPLCTTKINTTTKILYIFFNISTSSAVIKIADGAFLCSPKRYLIHFLSQILLMKKSLLMLLLLAAIGKTEAQRGLEIGIIALPQVSAMIDTTWWNAGEELNYAPTFKLAAGVQASLNLTHNIGIGAGFLYSNQGQHFTTGPDYQLLDTMGNAVSIPQRKFGLDLLYYKIPVFIKLNTSIQSPISFVFMAGLQMGLLQKARYFDKGLTDNGQVIFPAVDQDYMAQFNEQDISAMFAIDGRYNFGRKFHISLLLRGDYSLKTVVKASTTGQPTRNIRNANLGIQIGLHYVIGR